MTVTKRTRYEVLRRDDNTCRYCHATDQPLTIDHVVPVALGGTDDPSNLVAACKDCNAGKSSSSPDGTLVAQVKDDALRQAKQIEQAYAVLVERMGERDEYIEEFIEHFQKQLVPVDWRNTISRWFDMGVPIEIVSDAAEIAATKSGNFTNHGRFSYMCGIVWKQTHAVREAVSAVDAINDSIMSVEGIADERMSAYQEGYARGDEAGWAAGLKRYESRDLYALLLSRVIDGVNFVPAYFFPGTPQVSEAVSDPWAAAA